jgi:hypothetical protein
MWTTLVSLVFVAVPALAAVAAAWGLWRRKWFAFVPAVVVGLTALVPVPLFQNFYDREVLFAVHVEPRNIVLAWLLVDAAAVVCLVALWAGWSRAHWFWRLSALAGVPAAMSLVQANEPIALAAVVLPVVAGAAWWMRRRHDRRLVAGNESGLPSSSFRWQIRDALLLFVVVGEIALAIRSVVAGPFYVHWEHFATLAAALVLLGLSAGAAGGAQSSRWRWIGAAVCTGLIAAVTAVFVNRNNDVLGLAYFFDQPYIQYVGSGLFLMAVVGIPAIVGLVSAVYRWSVGAAGKGFAIVPRAVLVLASVTLLAPLVIAGIQMLPPSLTIKKPVPSATYDKIQTAGQKATGMRVMPGFNRKPIVQEVAAALAEPGNVWYDASQVRHYELSGGFDPSLHRDQMLYLLLDEETFAAEKARKPHEVLEISLLQWRLGRVLRQGGTAINWHMGGQAETCGRAAVSGVIDQLSDDDCRRALSEVRLSLAGRPSMETVFAYDAYWNHEWFGWRNELFRFARLAAGDQARPLPVSDEFLRQADARGLLRWRLLETRLVLELYHRRHGHWPESLSDLVPAYLSDVPIDPFSNRPLICRREGEEFTLYSVGKDGQDNGGLLPPDGDPDWRFSGGDIDWDCERRAMANSWPRKK